MNSLLSSNLIDWSGACEFDESGKVIGFKDQHNPSNSYQLRPIPKTEAVLADAELASDRLDEVMRPCTKKEFSAIITALSLHCALQDKTPQHIKSLMRDYWDDFGHSYPLAVVQEACALYRQLPADNTFMPKAGQLMQLAKPRLMQLQQMRYRVNGILGKNPAPVKRLNKPTSFSETLNKMGY